uniref:Uncharacterized protein n=1 Tax=Corethron hystrix TaxID=216773 RepID=A0A7S1BYM2_9STRA|mmetsp:Transcript_6982/g.15102  ORF Transcript_6982/g.15102 Transcript_6982/m.15102 type:complete len:187 (+) Transcript_6982:127-687(+)
MSCSAGSKVYVSDCVLSSVSSGCTLIVTHCDGGTVTLDSGSSSGTVRIEDPTVTEFRFNSLSSSSKVIAPNVASISGNSMSSNACIKASSSVAVRISNQSSGATVVRGSGMCPSEKQLTLEVAIAIFFALWALVSYLRKKLCCPVESNQPISTEANVSYGAISSVPTNTITTEVVTEADIVYQPKV